MAPTLNPIFWDLVDEIRVLLVESVSEATVITGEPETVDTITVNSGATIQVLDIGILAILRMQVAGQTIPKMKVSNLDKVNPGWEADTGTTLKGWFPFGLGKFGVYPKLTGSVTATIGYVPQPITADRPYTGAEVVDFPIEYNDAFTQYAAGMLRLKEGGFEFFQGIQTAQQFLDVMTSLSSFGYRTDSLKYSKALGVPANINSIVKA